MTDDDNDVYTVPYSLLLHNVGHPLTTSTCCCPCLTGHAPAHALICLLPLLLSASSCSVMAGSSQSQSRPLSRRGMWLSRKARQQLRLQRSPCQQRWGIRHRRRKSAPMQREAPSNRGREPSPAEGADAKHEARKITRCVYTCCSHKRSGGGCIGRLLNPLHGSCNSAAAGAKRQAANAQ